MTRFGLSLTTLGAALLTGCVLYGSGWFSPGPEAPGRADPGAETRFNAAAYRYGQAQSGTRSSLHYLLNAD